MKTERIVVFLIVLACVLFCGTIVGIAAPMGAAFTYQGRLIDANEPANGIYDFLFQLYDDPCTETYLTFDRVDDVEVVDGYFTVDIFFQNNFNGDARWMKINIRPGHETGGYPILSPRLEITPTPYAIYATDAKDAETLDGHLYSEFAFAAHNHSGVYATVSHSHSGIYSLVSHNHTGVYAPTVHLHNSDYVNVTGDNMTGNLTVDARVGIGTTNPNTSRKLDVRGGTGIAVYGESTSSTYAAIYGKSLGSGPAARFQDGDVIMMGGNVGIETDSPSTELDVDGSVRITNYTWPTSGEGLELAYNPSLNRGFVQVYADRSAGTFGEMFLGATEVGIGVTAPECKLDVRGNKIQLKEDATGDWMAMRTDGGGLDLSFQGGPLYIQSATANEHILLNSSGLSNVCIGATGPTERLDINGTIRLRGIPAQAGTTYVHVDGAGKLWKITSSRKYKTNIRDLNSDPMAALQLRPVAYQCKVSGKEDVGLIAEEVEQVLPDLVIHDEDGSPEAVKYDRVSLYLLDIVRELKTENDSLKQRLETLEQTVQRLAIAKEVQ